MTQEWDDILSEPMTRLQPDLPAAAGGWRAVRSIEEVSPRPQQPPLTLPDPAGMLQMRLPVQPEEVAPASAPPPASLTDQLSLTWASRRRGRRAATEEAEGETWPAWQPSEPPNAEPALPAPPRLSWLRPVQGLLRVLRLQPADEVPLQHAGQQRARKSVEQEAVLTPSRVLEPGAEEPRRAARSLEGVMLPLTLAKPVAAEAADEAPEVPDAPLDGPAEPHPTVRGIEPGVEPMAVPGQQDSMLRRWIARQRPKEALPEEAPAPEASRRDETPPFEAAPMVDRPKGVAMARHDDEAVEAPVAGESPAHTLEDFGSPLPTVLRERMEELLDVPLKDVRVFRNSAAQAATHDHGADALAVGTDVHLASGQGDPSTPSGEALLAHELSHVAAALRGRRESLHAEEQQAQAIEHRIKTQTVLEVARQPRQAPGPPLEHRMQARSHPVPTTTTFAAPSYSGGGFAGGSNGTAGGSGAPTAMAAPVGRITGTADVSQGSGGVGGYMGTASDTNLMDPRAEEPDEPGSGIERIVDAVMRRLRREGSFERERRGSFRSEIGG